MPRLTLLSAAAAAWLAAAGLAQAQAPIKIGFIAELSGPQGALGQDQYDAFMMVVERNGGKLGGVPVQVLREDSQLKPDVATQIVQKLIEKENVPIITGITFSNVMMAVHKPITEKGVFLIGSNAGPAPIAGAQCSPFQFITSWQNDNQAEVVGAYANTKGYKNVIGMAPNYQAGKDMIAGFKRYFKGRIVDEVYTKVGQTDYQAEISTLRAKNPKAVFVFYPGGMGIQFLKQYDQAGLRGKIPLYSVYTVDEISLPAVGEAAIGQWETRFWSPDLKNPANEKYVADFRKKYGRWPVFYGAQSYDGILLIDSAVRAVKGDLRDAEALVRAMRRADFPSVRGKFTYNTNNHPIQNFYLLRAEKDAAGELVMRIQRTVFEAHKDAYHQDCKLRW